MMDKKDLYMNVWYAEFAGVGYVFDGKEWCVFPLFKNESDAKKIWKEQMEPLNEKNLKMRFIELDGEYEFLLYPHPFSQQKVNFGFYRHLDSSDNYRVFKQKCKGRALFRFGVLEGQNPSMLHETKLVTDVKFMEKSQVRKDSIEWMAEDVQRQAKKKERQDRGGVV
jgi:hypothetical protein